MYFDPFLESARILCESGDLGMVEYKGIVTVLEDAENPKTSKYLEKLYESILSKGHVDFDDIPNSKGDIKTYKGYQNMIETLNNINGLANVQNVKQVVTYVNIILTAISNIDRFSDLYSKGFKLRNDYIMLEYNTFVYSCVQATSSLITEFVDYMKRPDAGAVQITIKNNKFKANIFYIEQLQKFNNVITNMDYKSFLNYMINKETENFIGTEVLVGVATVSIVAMAIVPITREIVYRFYHDKNRISECLAEQAYFLEMNKASVNSNTQLTSDKKKEILKRQERLQKALMKLSNKLKVEYAQAEANASKQLKQDNSLLTLDKIKTGIDNEPLSLL